MKESVIIKKSKKEMIKPDNGKIQIFDRFDSKIRGFSYKGEPYFVGKDVCDVLGYKNPNHTIKKFCKNWSGDNVPYDLSNRYLITEDALSNRYPIELPWIAYCMLPDAMNRLQKTVVINEANFNFLVFKSKIPKAEMIQWYAFSIIFPSIRETGKFEVKEKEVTKRLSKDKYAIQKLSDPNSSSEEKERATRFLVEMIEDRDSLVIKLGERVTAIEGRFQLEDYFDGMTERQDGYKKRAVEVAPKPKL